MTPQIKNAAVIAIIPARGGSQGIPLKNIQPLAGVPLLAWSIAQAQQTPEIDGVYVSTDHERVALVAEENGAEVIVRPADISGHTASSETALQHALDHLAVAGVPEPEIVVFLQATSPFRRPEDLSTALCRFRQEGADSLFAASPQHGFVWRRRGTALEPLTYDAACRPRRQEIGEIMVENGSFYLFRPAVLRNNNNRLGGRITVHPMGFIEALQIDEPADLELANWLMAHPRNPWREVLYGRNPTLSPGDYR